MKLKLFFVAVLTVFAFSCSEKSENKPTGGNPTPGEKPTLKTEQVAKGGKVKKDDPKSKRQAGEVSSAKKTGVKAAAPSPKKLSTTGSERYSTLLGGNKGGRKSSDALFGWYVDKINGQDPSADDEVTNYLFFFDEDGTYYEYDFVNDDWDWGFYYVDNDLEYIVFDAEDPDESVWEIVSVEADVITIKSLEGETLSLAGFDLSGFEDEDYTADELKTDIADKVWFFAYEYSDDESFNFLEEDGAESLEGFKFNSDGTFYWFEYSFTENGEDIVFEQIDEDVGTWSISNGVLTISVQDEEGPISLSMDIVYLDDEVFELEWEEDGESQVIGFLSETALEEEF